MTLTKLEHIPLMMDARYWRAQHDLAASRLLQQEARYKRFVLGLQEQRSSENWVCAPRWLWRRSKPSSARDRKSTRLNSSHG